MIKLNLWDNNFEGQESAVPGKAPKHVRWTRNRDIAHPDERTAPTIHTDWTLEMSEACLSG